jgi:pentatricopeptide repeat protein
MGFLALIFVAILIVIVVIAISKSNKVKESRKKEKPPEEVGNMSNAGFYISVPEHQKKYKQEYTPITRDALIKKFYSRMTKDDIELFYNDYWTDETFKEKIRTSYTPYSMLLHFLDDKTKDRIKQCPGIYQRLFSVIDDYANFTDDKNFLYEYNIKKAWRSKEENTGDVIRFYKIALDNIPEDSNINYHLLVIYNGMANFFFKQQKFQEMIDICNEAIEREITGDDWESRIAKAEKKLRSIKGA